MYPGGMLLFDTAGSSIAWLPAKRSPSGDQMALKRLLTPTEVAAALVIPVSTLHYWRTTGDGPPARKIGRHLRYDPDDLEGWLNRSRSEGSPQR